MPGVAAILTCRILGRPLRTLGLGTWNGRYVLIGYLIPIAYCLVASLGIWIFGFSGFPNTDFVRQAAEGFGSGGAPNWVVIAMFVVFLHASDNLWMQSIFSPLTSEREYTKWVASDLGLAFVVVAAVVAVAFWLKRGELPAQACG